MIGQIHVEICDLRVSDVHIKCISESVAVVATSFVLNLCCLLSAVNGRESD